MKMKKIAMFGLFLLMGCGSGMAGKDTCTNRYEAGKAPEGFIPCYDEPDAGFDAEIGELPGIGQL